MKNPGRQTFSSLRLAAGAFLGLVWLAGFTPAPAAAQGTPEQQQYCSGDAQRLCGEFIPDVAKVGACMSRKRSQLSAACRATMVTPSHHRHTTHHQS
jgi:hypothetical protein